MTTPAGTDERVHYHTCPLCEATCGLEIRTRGREVVGIRGDADDVFSRGFICPKGYAVKELDADPDRLRTPLIKRDGRFVPVSWDEAFAEIERRLMPIIAAARPRRGGRLPRQPGRPQPGADALQPRCCCAALGIDEHLLGQHRRPDAEAGLGRADVRHRAQRAGARPRSHRLPAGPRRRSVRLERQPDDRARRAGPPARHPRSAAARSW